MPLTIEEVNRYFELGVVVHPLCPADHHCQSPGKIPFDPIEGQHMGGWSDHEQFHMDHWREWIDYDSSINIGMLTGTASKLVGIDIDDPGGEEWVQEMWDGRTWEYTTGKGRRLLFRCTEPIKRSRVRDERGRSFEVLGEGTNNVLPPSEHASGRFYRWTPGLTPRDVKEPPELPPWVLGTASTPSNDDVNSDVIDWVPIMMNDITRGQRNEVLTQIVGRLVGPAPMTQKEAYLLALLVNSEYGKPPLAKAEVKAICKSIGRAEVKSQAALEKRAHQLKKQYDIPFDQALEMARDE